MKFICTLITVEDMESSRYFYETLLGQKVKYDFGENITFEGDFALHLKSHFQGLINREIKSGKNNVELYFEEDEIDKIFAMLIEQQVKFIHEIVEQPWRQKVMRFYDPDDYIIEIGESLEYLCYRLYKEGIEIDDISKITNMDRKFAKKSILKFKKTEKREI